MTELNRNIVPFSQCEIWEKQKPVDNSKTGKNENFGDYIPYYATANPCIAESYAHIILRFMLDYMNTRSYIPTKPFYIVELGAGLGLFSFYCIKRLVEYCKQLKIEKIPFVYVMTEEEQKNIEFWERHPSLQGFCENGELDFARFNSLDSEKIHLHLSGKTIAAPSFLDKNSNPLIVIANTVFSSMPQDIFNINEGNLEAGYIDASPVIGMDETYGTVTIRDSETHFEYQPCGLDFYKNEYFDAILKHYTDETKNNSFWFPVASMRFIDKLLKISNNKIFLLSTDKGSARFYMLNKDNFPRPVFANNNLSIIVNYDSIGRYIEMLDGDCIHQSCNCAESGLTTSVFSVGCSFDDLPETTTAVKTYFDSISFIDIYEIYNFVEQSRESFSLEMCVSLLKLTHWDPYVFNRFKEQIEGVIDLDPIPYKAIIELTHNVSKIVDNFYYYPAVYDVFHTVGVLFQMIQNFQEALKYYQRSIDYFGVNDTMLYQMGVCYCKMNNYKSALKILKEALRLNPKNKEAKELRKKLRSVFGKLTSKFKK